MLTPVHNPGAHGSCDFIKSLVRESSLSNARTAGLTFRSLARIELVGTRRNTLTPGVVNVSGFTGDIIGVVRW